MIKIMSCFFSICLVCSCNFYSFTGASVGTGVERIKIEYFKNDAKNYKSNIDVIITNKLTDLVLNQTNLEINKKKFEIEITGKIINYEIVPISISSDDLANLNRLRIEVLVECTNFVNKGESYKQNFTRYADYDSAQNIIDIEDDLIDQILNEICEDIFNKTFLNW